jgi:hypothetical protein
MRGSVLIMALALVILLVSLVGGYLFTVGALVANSGWEETDAKTLWLAEAGLQKAIWNLKTPAGSGGQGEGWTTAGTTENLGDGTCTMVVERWDFALAANGAAASDNPPQTSASKAPAKAIDGNASTYWESKNEPDEDDPQDLIVTFPYLLTINKVRFIAANADRAPEDYTWDVSTDGITYTTAKTVNGNGSADRTDTFSAQSSVNYLRLRTTDAEKKLRIKTLEAIGSKITSTGTLTVTGQTYTRTVSQTVVAGTQLVPMI